MRVPYLLYVGNPVTFDPRHVTYVGWMRWSTISPPSGMIPTRRTRSRARSSADLVAADVHIIGKDILRFHSITGRFSSWRWICPCPRRFLPTRGSTSARTRCPSRAGTSSMPTSWRREFTVDGVRYYALIRDAVQCGRLHYLESVISRFNTDLVNNLGNRVKRTLDMQKKYFDRVVAAPVPADTEAERALDAELAAACAAAYDGMVANMETYHVADAVACVFALLSRTNKYIDETAPWALAKDESRRDRLGTVLYNLLEAIRQGCRPARPSFPPRRRRFWTACIPTRAALTRSGVASAA